MHPLHNNDVHGELACYASRHEWLRPDVDHSPNYRPYVLLGALPAKSADLYPLPLLLRSFNYLHRMHPLLLARRQELVQLRRHWLRPLHRHAPTESAYPRVTSVAPGLGSYRRGEESP